MKNVARPSRGQERVCAMHFRPSTGDCLVPHE
jgi:hypothetical protein